MWTYLCRFYLSSMDIWFTVCLTEEQFEIYKFREEETKGIPVFISESGSEGHYYRLTMDEHCVYTDLPEMAIELINMDNKILKGIQKGRIGRNAWSLRKDRENYILYDKEDEDSDTDTDE